MTQPDNAVPADDSGSGVTAPDDTSPASDLSVPATTMPIAVRARVADTDPGPTDPSVLIRRLTRLGFGALLASGEATRKALGTQTTPSPLTDVGLGALALAREASLAAGRAATDAARQAADAADPVVRQVASHPAFAPLVESSRSGVDTVLGALGDAGRAERQRATDETEAAMRRSVEAAARSDLLPDTAHALAAGALPETIDAVLPGVVDRLAEDPELLVGLVNGVMDRLAEHPETLEKLASQLVDPVVGQALPVTLDALGDESEAIAQIVRAQSGGLADEMANSFRARGVSADDAVDRFVGRVKRPWRRNGARKRNREQKQ